MRIRKFATMSLAVLSVVALAAGCSSTQKDQTLANDIKAKMFSDPQVKAAKVDVAVKDGEATLSGEVPDDGARYEAFKIATDTPGVKHVVDKMEVHTAQVVPAAEPAPIERPRAPKPVRNESKHHANSNLRSVKSEPDPAPAPPPAASMPPEQPVAAAPPPPPRRSAPAPLRKPDAGYARAVSANRALHLFAPVNF